MLAARRSLESPLRVPESYRPWVQEISRAQVDGIRARSVRVVGDLEELAPQFTPGGIDDPADAGAEALLDASLDAVLGLAREVRRLSAEREASPPGPDHAP